MIWRVLFIGHISDQALSHILNSESIKCGKWTNTKYLEQQKLWLHIKFYFNFLNKQQTSAKCQEVHTDIVGIFSDPTFYNYCNKAGQILETLWEWNCNYEKISVTYFIVHKIWSVDNYSKLSALQIVQFRHFLSYIAFPYYRCYLRHTVRN